MTANTPLVVMVPVELKAAASARARSQDVSVSQLVRSLLRRELIGTKVETRTASR